MGVRLSWLAAQGVDKASLLARLGLMESGVASDELNSPLVCAEYPDGWLVLVSDERGLDLDQALPLVSTDGLALGCELEEHVMFSRLRAFHGRAPIWSVTHDPDVDLNDVTVEGDPPPPFADLRAALAAEQAQDEDVDHMFDLPARLGQQLCGYAYDDPYPVVWTILERAGSARSQAPARLPAAFASELLPLLTASGWALAAQDPDFRGRAWDVTRVVDGRREVLAFVWSENGPQLQFEANFVVLDGADRTDNVVCAGETRPMRPAGGARSGRSLWRRIADHFRGRATDSPPPPPPPPPDPLARLVSRVKEDLAAIEAFLTSGEESPRIRVTGEFPR